MLMFGVVGYMMRKLNYPMAPAVLAIVLGPLAEEAFRQTMISYQGDITVLVQRPLSGTFVFLAAALFVYPLFLNARRKRQGADSGAGEN
jgi:putative tricarboxylic transport membrane protein